MRRYPLPRCAVDTALGCSDPDPVVAAGEVTKSQILELRNRIREDGPSDRMGGVSAAKWVERMADKLDDFCPSGDCDEVGLYAVVDPDDHNVAYSVLRSDDFVGFDHWDSGAWQPHDLPDEIDLRIIGEEDARFIIEALDEGCDGAYLHPGDPIGFLSRDEEVILSAASGTWDESKHKRAADGKFAPKDSSEKQTTARRAKAADMARYVREGGSRPSGVKPAASKGRGSGGGGGAAKKAAASKRAAAAKAKKAAAERKRKEAQRARAKWQKARDRLIDQENAERKAKAQADLESELETQQLQAEDSEARQKIGAQFADMISKGMSVAEAERLTQQAAAEQARAVAAKQESVKARDKIRKLEYARRMAELREAKAKMSRSRPKAVRAAAEAPEKEHVTWDNWVIYAVVDDLDPNAVMAVIRMRNQGSLELEVWADGDWQEDPELLSRMHGVDPPALVELTDEQIESLLAQMEADGEITAAVSPDPRAARLRAYWVSGKGRLKIRWGSPGDFTRCVRQLRKYLGPRTKGYCANLHKMATGMWPGDRRNRGVRGAGPSEDVLWDAVLSGGWHREQPAEVDMLNDGIYSEVEDDVLSALVAGASFPVEPPDEWFQDPGLKGPTPLTVDDSGHVFGHIATFDVPHIGMPGKVHAPRSRSGYAFFKTGSLRTASGNQINVGQLTLAGGHAPLSADAAMAVKHYDDTKSAIADLNVGEDRYGIWVAGAVRPEISPEQMRALRAAAPSGDWRPINGSLELVAVCQVNVPGFPVARARVASGAVMALVAAGARPLAVQKASLIADAAVLERIEGLEHLVMGEEGDDIAPEAEAVVEEAEAVVEEAAAVPESVARAREYIRNQRMERLRKRVYGRESEGVTAAFGGEWSEGSREKAAAAHEALPDGSFPIHDVEDLKRAIHAFGRAKDKDKVKAHIKKRAKALGAEDLIPEDWK